MENIFEQECNFGMKWIIPRSNFAKFEHKSVHQSDFFKANLPGAIYSFRLLPDGHLNDNDHQTYVYMELNTGMMENIYCDYYISIKFTSITKRFGAIFKASGTWGGAICSRKQLLNPAPFSEENLVIEIQGTMKGKGFKADKEKCVPLIKSISQRNDMDVTVFTGDEKIMVHGFSLKAHSTVFKDMLKDNQEMFIELHEFSTPIIEAVINFCYGKDIKSFINFKNAIEFLCFSDKFKMEDLKNTIEEYLINQISDENVCQLSSKSVEFNAKQLRECCICFLLLKKPDEISNILNWEILDKEICQEIVQRALAFVSKNCF